MSRRLRRAAQHGKLRPLASKPATVGKAADISKGVTTDVVAQYEERWVYPRFVWTWLGLAVVFVLSVWGVCT